MQSLHNREITSRNKRIAERNKIKPLKLNPPIKNQVFTGAQIEERPH